MVTEKEISELISEARAMRGRAFVVHGHAVGAAILTEDGEIFGGCNVESHISGLGRCAEMVAIEHAVLHGKNRFRALAVSDENFIFPCGACLQFLLQFSQNKGKDISIFSAHSDGKIRSKYLFELLPEGYESHKI